MADNIAETNDRKYESYGIVPPLSLRPHAVSTTRYDDVARLIDGLSGRFLDFGCGNGILTIALAGKFAKAVGVDVSRMAVEQARTMAKRDRPGAEGELSFSVVEQDGKLPFPDASFDVVACLGCLEHVVDPFEKLREIHRVLVPGGTFIANVPNIAYLRHRLRLLTGRLPETAFHNDMAIYERFGWDGGHLHYFTRQSFESLLRYTGFRPRACSGSGRWAKFRRWWPSLLCGDMTVCCTAEARHG